MVALKRISAGLIAALLVSTPASAQPELERKVKSAYVLNFAKFISWSESAFTTPLEAFSICVDDTDTAEVLTQIVNGRKIGQRNIQVFNRVTANCRIVFLTGDRPNEVAASLSQSAGPGVLTVYQTETHQPGGVIRFVLADRKIRFEIDREAAAAADLSISSKLLRVAIIREGQ